MRPFYRAEHYGMKNSVGYLVRRTSNLILPQFEALFAENELTFSQWTVLMALREWQDITSAEVARNICHDAGSLTRMLDQLEQRGLIARLRSDTDRRAVTLTLTPRGSQMVESLMPRVVDFWNRLLGDFSHVEIKTLIKLLGRLVDAAGGVRDEVGQARRRKHLREGTRRREPAAPRRGEAVMKKSLASLTAALLSASVLAGCVDTPPTEPQFKPIEAPQLGLGTAAAPHFPGDWWTAFKDPQIDRLALLVMANNPSLQMALARLHGAQAALAANQTAQYPQVTLDGQEQRLLFSKNYVIPPPFGGTYQWYGQVAANIGWNLDFWGKTASQIEQARRGADAAALDLAAAHIALSGAFAQTYLNLTLAWTDSDIAEANVRERADILKLTQDRAAQGLENDAAVEQAKALLAMARVDQTNVLAQRETIVHALAALTGQGADAYPAIVRPMPQLDVPLPLPDKLPMDLLARRPDVIAAQARIDAAFAGREAAHADFYPNVNIVGLVGFQSIGLSNLLTGNSFTYGAGPAIHLPLFDAGRIRAQYAGATAELDGAIASYNDTVLSAVRQTADALTQVRAIAEQRQQQAQALASAERSFSLAQSRYRSGLFTQIEVLNAESTVLATRQRMAALVAQYAVQRITLILCVGGGFEAEGPPPAQTASAKPPG